MNPRLPRIVVWLLGLVLPGRVLGSVLRDLEDDLARAREHGAARAWLFRETCSLIAAYSVAAARQLWTRRSVWARDVRLVVRGLKRGAFAALGAAALLSTGLAATAVTVGLTRALLLRPVSSVHGEALRRVTAVDRQGRPALRLSFVELQLVRDHLADDALLTAVNLQPVVARVDTIDVQTMAEAVDGRYFQLTGTDMVVGRPILATDDRPGTPPVAVISEPFWRRHYGASPQVTGRIIGLNGHPFAVIGVARVLGSSSFLGASVDAWIALSHADPLLNPAWRTDIDHRWFTAFVLPTSSLAAVEARLAAAAADLGRLHPGPWRERALQTTDGTVISGTQRADLVMLVSVLAGLSALIVAAAASNVGGVLLARAAASRRHIALHLSLGSGRAAIVRRHLIEGALLGVAGSGLAILLYAWMRRALSEVALLPTLALRVDLPFDATALALLAGSGILVGMLLAVGPGLWSARVGLHAGLADADARVGSGHWQRRLRRGLVSAQVCLALTLIVGAALFSRSLATLITADLGFPRARLVAMDFDREPSAPPGMLPEMAREALARARTTPGVVSAAMSNRAPIDPSTPSVDVAAGPGMPTLADVTMYLATEAYFETVGIPLVAGRPFTPDEVVQAADVVIVNERLAAQLWPEDRAIGRSLVVVGEPRPLRVVGVARNSRYRSITEPDRPHLYRPTPPGFGLTLLARTSADPRVVLGALGRTLDAVAPGLVGFFPRTLDDHLAIELLPTRAAALAAAALGTLGLLLSAVGLYTLVAWFVEQRRREIGVRMALGAGAGAVRGLVVRQALAAAVPGMTAGVLLAWALARLARNALYGVAALDPPAFAAGVAALAAIVMTAAYLPSRRATRIDPASVLRQ